MIPDSVQRLIALFEHELSGVEFPEVGAGVLGQAVAEVEEHARRVESARAELAAAEAALEASRNALVRVAERGLAYARIYATDDPALADALAAIQLGSARPERGKVRRKRRDTSDGADSSAISSLTDSSESSWTGEVN